MLARRMDLLQQVIKFASKTLIVMRAAELSFLAEEGVTHPTLRTLLVSGVTATGSRRGVRIGIEIRKRELLVLL